jgi:hypothetical protein
MYVDPRLLVKTKAVIICGILGSVSALLGWLVSSIILLNAGLLILIVTLPAAIIVCLDISIQRDDAKRTAESVRRAFEEEKRGRGW